MRRRKKADDFLAMFVLKGNVVIMGGYNEGFQLPYLIV